MDGHGDVEVESEDEMQEVEPDPGESEGEREPSSEEVDIGDEREESEAKDAESDEKEDYGHRVAMSRRNDIIESGSERSEEQHYADREDEEVDQARSPRLFPFCLICSIANNVHCCVSPYKNNPRCYYVFHACLVLKFTSLIGMGKLCDSSKSPDGEKDQNPISQSAAEIRDVFGDSDDEEEAGYAVRNEIEHDSHVSIGYQKQLITVLNTKSSTIKKKIK